VDSSAFIALLSNRDQYHSIAELVFRDAATSRKVLLTTNLILAEIHRLTLHRAGIRAAIAALNKIESSSLIRIQFATAEHHSSAKEWIASLSDYPISYTDAISFAVMDSVHCTAAITFDRHFLAAGFTPVNLS
jgi:uncharacterized protein